MQRNHRLSRHHAAGLGILLDQCARRDHLRHVEAVAVLRAQPPEGRVGHARHRGEDDGRLDLDRTDLQRHSDVSSTPTCASSRRSNGSDSPMTLLGSPSTPSMNGADLPSRVNAPATRNGSPLATYAAISSSLGSPKCTTVSATSLTIRPVGTSTTQ